MRKVFLDGGGGFIGVNLTRHLLAQGIEVTCYDNFSSTCQMSDVSEFIGHPNYKLIVDSICRRAPLTRMMQGHDTVWHLAANTIIPGGDTNRSADLENNVIGTVNVLEAMVANGITSLLFASTAATYGDEPGKLLSEGHGPMRPISLYGASKLAAEAFVSAYAHLFGIHASIFRFSNVVGGGMAHGVIYDLIQKLKKTPDALPIWGDGKGEKPYMLVEDVIRGMIVAHSIDPDVRPLCDIYNLGCDTVTSVDRVADIVIEEMGLQGAKKVFAGGRHGFPGDVPIVRYDPSKMASYGWRTSKTSDEAVRITVRRLIAVRL